ncbi:MAG: hypothetical protein PHS01_11920 [Dysgonamonadaceae bacterium]|nr:hypothetical protein [Dysgonamonadaceae bacterium]
MKKKKRSVRKNESRVIGFNILESIDLKDDYSVRMVSFCIAYNDLIHVHGEMIKRSSNKYRSYRLYLLKIAIFHMREAYWMLKKCFEHEAIGGRLSAIPEVADKWQNIIGIVDGTDATSFAKVVLFESRNLISHYGFWEKSDKDMILKIAEEMSVGMVQGKISIGESQGDTYFEFADRLLLNTILTLGEKYGLSEKEFFFKISSLVVEIIDLLYIVIIDFLTCISEIRK